MRLLLALTAACTLTSCGTATHLLGQASGLVNSVTSPVLGAIRLSESDSTDLTRPPTEKSSPYSPYSPVRHDARRPAPQR